MNRQTAFRQGMTDGIPIALGYMAVSFTFGIMAKNAGLTAFQAVLLSLTNLTSAGHYYGLSRLHRNGFYPACHQSEILSHVLRFIPETGAEYTVFPSFFYRLWQYG